MYQIRLDLNPCRNMKSVAELGVLYIFSANQRPPVTSHTSLY